MGWVRVRARVRVRVRVRVRDRDRMRGSGSGWTLNCFLRLHHGEICEALSRKSSVSSKASKT